MPTVPAASITDFVVHPLPPAHGPAVVIDGSRNVLSNNLPACRMGDTIAEAVGPPNKIAKGEFTVIIGQSGSGSAGGPQSAALQAASAAGAPFVQKCPFK